MPAWSLTLERWVTFLEKVLEQTTVTQQDPFPSETRVLPSSESDMEEFSVEVQTGN